MSDIRRWGPRSVRLALCWLLLAFVAPWQASGVARAGSPGERPAVIDAALDRSPTDLALSPDERWLVTANRTSDTLSLIDVDRGRVVHEVPAGDAPAHVAFTPDGSRVLSTAAWSGELRLFRLDSGRLTLDATIALGFEPRGVVVAPDSSRAYVALALAGEVVELDLTSRAIVRRVKVGPWPRQLALSQDGRRLAVAANGAQHVAVVEVPAFTVAFEEPVEGINFGQMEIDPAGEYVYFPWVIYRHNPIDARNIRLGWVLATRIGRVRLAESVRRQAISLDPPGVAVGDPHGLGLTADGARLVATAAGTHELLVYRRDALRFQDFGGPGDLIERDLLADSDRFFRVPLGGRPLNLRVARDSRRVFVANELSNAVQVVDLDKRRVTTTIPLGGPAAPSLARRGEAIFHDARRSLDQWYSCATCHYEGGTNAVPMDTHNDGSIRTFKSVLPLYHVTQTAPWTWHGWQGDLAASVRKSFTETMLGPEPTADDVRAALAYLESLPLPPNPRQPEGAPLSAAAERGRAVFESDVAGCSACHSGPLYTDGQVHDVGLASKRDAYQGYNTPSLVGLVRRVRYLHDGRAKSLEELLTGPHNPAQVTGRGELTAEQRADLIEFLLTL